MAGAHCACHTPAAGKRQNSSPVPGRPPGLQVDCTHLLALHQPRQQLLSLDGDALLGLLQNDLGSGASVRFVQRQADRSGARAVRDNSRGLPELTLGAAAAGLTSLPCCAVKSGFLGTAALMLKTGRAGLNLWPCGGPCCCACPCPGACCSCFAPPRCCCGAGPAGAGSPRQLGQGHFVFRAGCCCLPGEGSGCSRGTWPESPALRCWGPRAAALLLVGCGGPEAAAAPPPPPPPPLIWLSTSAVAGLGALEAGWFSPKAKGNNARPFSGALGRHQDARPR